MEQLLQSNTALARILKSKGIKKFYITTLGNSLASGYSMANKSMPLLERNHSLRQILFSHGIEPNIYAFTRMENNNDEKIHSWYHLSDSEQERIRFNRHDAVKLQYFTKEELEKYYSEHPEHNDNLKDVIGMTGDDVANILVYSGATGSFLDNVTRGGLPKKSLSGFKRDFRYIEITLKEICKQNNKSGSKTQVYLCGVPNYKGLNLTNFVINKYLQRLAKKYPNVVYVKPVYASLIYKNGVDVHLNKEEYEDYNNAVIESITENYTAVNSKIEIEKVMYDLKEIVGTKGFITDDEIKNALSKYIPSLDGLDYDISGYIDNIRNYIYDILPQELKEKDETLQDLNIEYPEVIVCNAKTGEVITNADTEVDSHIFGTVNGDFTDIEGIMTNTLFENRKQNKNIQVYVIGTGDKDVDKNLNRIINEYIHASFINPEDKVNQAIDMNYGEIKSLIESDRTLYQINEELELLSKEKEQFQAQRKLVADRASKYTKLVGDKKTLRKYLLDRMPYDFYYIGKKQLKQSTR